MEKLYEWVSEWQLLSRVRLLATPWAVAHQAPLSVEFSKQEYWSGLPFPSPEALYSQQTQDRELTVAQIMNSLLQNTDLNWRK